MRAGRGFARTDAVLALSLLLLPGRLSAQEASSVSFTQAQANRGRTVYAQSCASCHGRTLTDGSATPLAGEQFQRQWSSPDRSLRDLFTLIRTRMPAAGKEGSLSTGQYLAVTAFLLESNGLIAGDRPLTDDPARLASERFPASSVAADTAKGWGVKTVAPDFQVGPRGLEPTATGPTRAEIRDAAGDARDWLTEAHDPQGTRYSGLAQIDTLDVTRLQVACSFQVGEPGSFQTGPVVYRGTMYLTTAWATMALDAATCRPKWRYDWTHALTANPANRGVAIQDGKVVRGTPDGYLIALDAADGELLWSRKIADVNRGEQIRMAPLVYGDLIFIGPGVSEYGIKGWIGAFRLEDGAPVWKFHIVPEPGEPGYETWAWSDSLVLGGGGVWTAPSVDEKRGLLYVATTNPAPDIPADLRGGANLYTNSVLALEMKTGRLSWYDQIVPRDSHDWDLTHVTPLYRATIDGRPRDLMTTVGKDGLLRVFDRHSRKRLFETPVTTIENGDAPITKDGTHACPGGLGGVEWSGPAYDPGAHLLVTPSVDWCMTFFSVDTVSFVPGQLYLGGGARFDSVCQGWVTAVDATTGDVRWRYRSPRPVVAAVTTTAGGLVFAGELTGDLIALDATTGQVLFRQNTGGPVGGGIITYEVDGRQYVAVASGRPSAWWVDEFPGAATITVFALPGG